MSNLKNKNIIVTGASGGIGNSIVEKLHNIGANILATGTKIEKLEENYNTIDWICALSGKPIRAKIDNFDLENFVHPEYHDALLAPMVDSRILKSSVEFRKHVKKLLLNKQREFLYHARKNSKIDL